MAYLFALPWLALLAFLVLRVRLPRELPQAAPLASSPDAAPFVSVVVPSRNEAVNIERCVASLAASDYPDFEIVVVDDRSEDDTADRARSVAPGGAKRIHVVDGADLPEGWLGKPWACWQGAAAAAGDLLLFTDADTVHEPALLGRAVAGLREDAADLLTVTGRQVMESFWERLIQPQIFLTMIVRFHDPERTVRRRKWRDAIANGQFMLFPRASYEAIGGHEAVKDEVAEDLALAQRVMREGHALSIRIAEDDFATRMYRSLGGLVEGWSKNLVMGGLQTVTPRLRPFVAPASFLMGVTLWLAPPVVLVMAMAGLVGPAWLAWSGTVVAISAILWIAVTARMGAPPAYGLLYPLGAAVATYIFLRSWVRGRRVEWKGRRYVLRDVAERP